MRSAPPLRSVRNDWHRLFDASVPRLVEGADVRMLATRADQVGGMERWRLAVGEQGPFDRFYDREVVGWWSA